MNYLVFGFPGVGKTSYVRKMKEQPRKGTVGAIDFDVKGPDCFKGNACPIGVLNAASELVISWLNSRADVMTHFHAVNPYIVYPAMILAVKPVLSSRTEWAERITRRGDVEFAKRVYEHYVEWLDNATTYICKLREAGNIVKIIHIGTEEYLSDVMYLEELVR